MKILIAGGSGFIGRSIEQYFGKKGHDVCILTRSPRQTNEVLWDARSIGSWTNELSDTDVLINLTGKSVDCRYTKANKAEILRSRIDSTAILNEALQTVKHSVSLYINASSATIYEHSIDKFNTELDGVIGDDFSMNVVKLWEQEFFKADDIIRRVAMRISIVMGTAGGAFPKIKMITKLGLGGHHGDGLQKVSWIHVDDLMGVIEYIIYHEELSGPVNVTSPRPVSNRILMKAVRKAVHIPIGIPQPSWLLEIGSFFLRTETELLLKSRYVYPQKLMESGFKFRYETIDQCMASLSN